MRGETSAFQHPVARRPKSGCTHVQQPEQPEPSGSVERISTDERTRAICDGAIRKRQCGLLANRRVEAGSENRRLGQGRVKPHRAGWAVSQRGFDEALQTPHTSKQADGKYHAKQSTASAAVWVLSLVRPPPAVLCSVACASHAQPASATAPAIPRARKARFDGRGRRRAAQPLFHRDWSSSQACARPCTRRALRGAAPGCSCAAASDQSAACGLFLSATVSRPRYHCARSRRRVGVENTAGAPGFESLPGCRRALWSEYRGVHPAGVGLPESPTI